MKTLILYTSKYGTTAKIAQQMASCFDDVTLIDLNNPTDFSLSQFDTVIIGTPVYAGNIAKAVKQFLNANQAILKPMNYGIFVCGLEKEHKPEFFTQNFPAVLLENATIIKEVGGYFDPARSSFIEKSLMKMITKSTAIQNTINEEAITELVTALKKISLSIWSNDAVIIKMDTSGKIVWQKNWGGTSDYDEFYAVEITPTNKIIASGYIYSTTIPANGTGEVLTNQGSCDAAIVLFK